MAVVIDGSNTPTAGGVVYGDGTEYASTAAGTSGQALISAGASAPSFGTLGIAGGGTNSTATPTAGGVGYGTGSAHAYTSAGTSGQVLTSAGAGAPTWSTPSSGGLTFISTLTPANGTSTSSITSLSSYKSIIVITDGAVTLSTTSGLNFAISTDNGSTYSSATNFTNTNGSGPRGFLQIYRTDSSSSIKNGFTINPSSTAANVQMDTAVTGTVNAIRIGITAGATFTGTGNIFIYGMN